MVAAAHEKTFGLIASLIGVLGCANNDRDYSNGAKTIAAAVGADSVRLLDLDGRPFDLLKSDGNRVRVVVFTRSDCPVSNRYAPDVRALYETFHPRGVDIYLIYVDPKEQPDAIRTHLKEFAYPCPALRDPDHTLVAFTQATVTPEAVVFDNDGRITYHGRIDDLYAELGNARVEATKNNLHDAIEATLAAQPVAEPVAKAVGCYIGDLK